MDGVWLGPGTGSASQLALHTDPPWNPAGHPPYCGRTLPDSGCPGVVSYPPRAARSLLLSIERYCDGMVRRVQTWSVSPAAMAGVQGRHCLAEPLPWVGAGWGNGRRRLAWGKQKSLNLS